MPQYLSAWLCLVTSLKQHECAHGTIMSHSQSLAGFFLGVAEFGQHTIYKGLVFTLPYLLALDGNSFRNGPCWALPIRKGKAAWAPNSALVLLRQEFTKPLDMGCKEKEAKKAFIRGV